MPSGPNCFFVSPSGEMIISGSTDGSSVPNDLFGGNCVADSSNRGSLSSFVIGNPTAATSLNIRINQSGSMSTATYVWKDGSSTDSFSNYYGEPDRRWEWDRHSFFITDPTVAQGVDYKYWDSTQNTGTPDIGYMQGCCLEDIQKEFIYVKGTGSWNDTKLGVYYRTISNTESGWSCSEITGLKDGTKFLDSSYFSVCTHTDGKIKLAVIYDFDIDIYESSDGINFTLVCELAASRFAGFRLIAYPQQLKIASSGAYLKIVFSSIDIVNEFERKKVFYLERLGPNFFNNEELLGERALELIELLGLYDGTGTLSVGSDAYGDAIFELWVILGYLEGYELPQSLLDTIEALPISEILAAQVSASLAANQDAEFTGGPWEDSAYWLGSITSADGGATWQLSDLPSKRGSNIPRSYQMDSFDMTGLSDGSGQFILMFKAPSREVTISTFNKTAGAYVDEDKFIPDLYYGAISVGVSSFIIHKNLTLKNLFSTGVPYLCCNNDWIWFLSAAEYSSALEDYISLQNENNQKVDTSLYTEGGDMESILEDIEDLGLIKNYDILFKENQMYFIPLKSDPSKNKWTNLGSKEVFLDSISFGTSSSSGVGVYEGYELLAESVTTGAVGSYHLSPKFGNMYSCGPHIAWTRGFKFSDRNTYANVNHVATYSRFSGWQTLPANATNTDLISGNMNSDPFRHQPRKVLSKPEFNFQWGLPACTDANGATGIGSWHSASTQGSCWRTQRDSATIIQASPSSMSHIAIRANSTAIGTKGFFTFVDPTVPDVDYWTTGAGSNYSFAPPEFQLMAEGEYPEVVYGIRPFGQFRSKRFHGLNCSFTLGDICDSAAFKNNTSMWSDTNNDIGDFIGVKLRTYIYGQSNINPQASSPALNMEVQIQFTTNEVRVYLPYASSLSSKEIIKLTPDTSVYGVKPFQTHFWECRLSLSTQRFQQAISPTQFSVPRFQLSIRRWGSNEWITSSVFENIDSVLQTGYFAHRLIQFASIGIFEYSASSPDAKHVKIKDFKIVRDNDLGQYNMFASVSDESKIDAVRGRSVASLPCFIKNQQSIIWGGSSGYDGDKYSYKTESNYDSSNTIKYASPQIQYRTVGSTDDVKTGNADIVISLPDSSRSVGNNVLLHSGIGLFNINAESVSLQYSDDSAFTSPTTIFQSSTKVATGRIVEAGYNNHIRMRLDGEDLNKNNSKYSQTKNNTYYAKFATLSSGVTPDINGLSFSIKTRRDQYFTLDIPSFNLNDSSAGLGSNLVGTTIEIYSDTMLSMFSKPTTNISGASKFMKINFSGHLGTDSFYKVGSVICGMTYGFQNVPINWEHRTEVAANVQSFSSRSGIRWGYENGPSVTKFSGTIVGDVFKQERENIKRIMQSTTQFSNRPIAMVFDDSSFTSPTIYSTGLATIKMYVDPENILYGTMDNQLSLSNAGWGYDENTQKWVPIGDMQITITETV